ncbi:MAG: hypothetical protein KF729_37665 [Sandaracinaceae bacterium]|nr:hypothetical protein [Sandaracinaceae bacterium]
MTRRAVRVRRALRLMAAWSGLALWLACGPGGDDGAADPSAGEATSTVEVRSVVFARELDASWQPVGGAITEVRADESRINARVTLAGRPRQGTIHMRWMWRDLEVGTASIDLADVNSGVLFSFGQDTFIKGWLNVPFFYIGDGYRLVLLDGERELGNYPFHVRPPDGARPSRFVSAELYRADPRLGDPGAPTRQFAPGETVYAVIRAALGHRSWLNAVPHFDGQPQHQLAREAMGEAGGGDEGNYLMELAPPNGWTPGSRVVIVLDDAEVASFPIEVTAGG